MGNAKKWGSLVGRAKEWAQQELKNATKVGGDPREHHGAEEVNEERRRNIERDAERMAQETALEALLPQSVKDYRDHAEAERARRRTESEEAARADRAARVTDSTLVLAGAIVGTATDLAVAVTVCEPDGALAVQVEAVDAVQMQGGSVSGFGFTIPAFHGDGRYDLVDSADFDALQYELYVVEENEGWAFHPSYGPGVIIVADGYADVHLTVGGCGSELIELSARVALGPR